MRATICADVYEEDECAVIEASFDRWRDRLSFVSANEGCGSCADIWNVDGPGEAISELPAKVRAVSDWTDIS